MIVFFGRELREYVRVRGANAAIEQIKKMSLGSGETQPAASCAHRT
jgi:hypothetical protein